MVLRGGADQGRAADIDILDAILAPCARRDGLRERVEVRDEEIDLADAVLGQGCEMVGAVTRASLPAQTGAIGARASISLTRSSTTKRASTNSSPAGRIYASVLRSKLAP